MNNKYQNFLQHLGEHLVEYSEKTVSDHQNLSGEDKVFASGYLMGRHKVASLMQQNAETFDIDIKELSLNSISEKDFLN